MNLSFSEQIRIILKRKNMTVENLAALIGTSKQNLNQKLLKSDFKESDMKKIAAALGFDLVIELVEK